MAKRGARQLRGDGHQVGGRALLHGRRPVPLVDRVRKNAYHEICTPACNSIALLASGRRTLQLCRASEKGNQTGAHPYTALQHPAKHDNRFAQHG